MKRRCPKCGKLVTQEETIDNFCIDCYVKEKEILKIPDIEIKQCPNCKKFEYQSMWYDNLEDIEKKISKNIKVIPELNLPRIDSKLELDFDKKIYNLKVTLKFILQKKFKKLEFDKKIKVKKEVCKVCSRIAGDFYTSILQIRFESRKLEEMIGQKIYNEIHKIIEEINTKNKKIKSTIRIIKEKYEKKGIDFYLDNSKLTHGIQRHLLKHKSAHSPNHSTTLVGVDQNGQRVYRHTFVVHFGDQKEN